MIEYKCFKDGKLHAVTFSYDDAPPEDYKLAKIFDKYGMKATFNLTSKNLTNGYGVKAEDVKKLYANHEVAVHTENHPWLEKCDNVTVINEVLECRRKIEKACGYVIRGMAYPYGTYNENVISTLKSCGIVYSRNVNSTKSFNLPSDFMEWKPTCHHRDAMECCDRFLASIDNPWSSMLFYIWGHSFELPKSENCGYDYIEKLCARLAEKKDKIWFATNIEIYDYIMAQRALHISADESFVYNPTQIDVWIKKDGETYKIPSGQTVKL